MNLRTRRCYYLVVASRLRLTPPDAVRTVYATDILELKEKCEAMPSKCKTGKVAEMSVRHEVDTKICLKTKWHKGKWNFWKFRHEGGNHYW